MAGSGPSPLVPARSVNMVAAVGCNCDFIKLQKRSYALEKNPEKNVTRKVSESQLKMEMLDVLIDMLRWSLRCDWRLPAAVWKMAGGAQFV